MTARNTSPMLSITTILFLAFFFTSCGIEDQLGIGEKEKKQDAPAAATQKPGISTSSDSTPEDTNGSKKANNEDDQSDDQDNKDKDKDKKSNSTAKSGDLADLLSQLQGGGGSSIFNSLLGFLNKNGGSGGLQQIIDLLGKSGSSLGGKLKQSDLDDLQKAIKSGDRDEIEKILRSLI